MTLKQRDTDADWRRIGETEPYWGVISQDRFLRERLDEAALRAFYESGEHEVALTCERAARFLGGWPRVEHALDFGCGCGRLTLPMAERAGRVTGYDVSPAMIELARARAADHANVSFAGQLPPGPVDWINSFNVFQHIDPARGLATLATVLGELAPGGLVSLHFTVYRDPALAPARGFAPKLRAGLRAITGRRPDAPLGSVLMYDYDLGAIVRTLHHRGVMDLAMFHVDHSGHHGLQIIGRRTL